MTPYPKSFTFFTTFLLIFLMIFTPVAHHQAVPEAKAITVVEKGINKFVNIKSSIENTISTIQETITAISITKLEIKEFILDYVAWNIAKLLIQQMTASIIDWINSGFQGSPAFVTDLEGFLLGALDQAAGDYIAGSDWRVLCSPFHADIELALTVNVRDADLNNRVPECTLTGVIDNVDSFFSGNFSEGGWAGWFEITSQPQNTPYGAYLAAEAELSDLMLRSQAGQLKLLDFGDGFLSASICDEAGCVIDTPGKILQDLTTAELSTGRDSLIQADEFNEIMAALLSQLSQQAITGVNGLLGMGSAAGGRYTNRFGQNYTNNLRSDSPVGQDNSTSPLDTLRGQINDNIDFYDTVESEANRLQNEIRAARQSIGSCFNVTLNSDLDSDITLETINDYLDRALIGRDLMFDYLDEIDDLDGRVAASDPDDTDLQQQLALEYNSLMGRLSGDVSEATSQVARDEIYFDEAVNAMENKIDDRINYCQNRDNFRGSNGE